MIDIPASLVVGEVPMAKITILYALPMKMSFG
jgi:hypothetical protein